MMQSNEMKSVLSKILKRQAGGSMDTLNLQYIGSRNNIAAYRRADGKIEYYSLNPEYKNGNIPGVVLDDANQQWYKLIYEGKDKNGFAQQNINYNREKENMNPNYNQPEMPNLVNNIQTKPTYFYNPIKKQNGGLINYIKYARK